MHGYVQAIDAKSSYIRRFYQRRLELGKHLAEPDFISIYIYAYDAVWTGEGFLSRRASDPLFVKHALANLREDIRAAGMSDKKVYVTEWNLTVSDRNYINDSCFKGVYIVKNYINSYRDTDMMAYFHGSDRIAEYFDTDYMLYGGSGLITRDGIFKPAAFAFEFLNRLYRYYISGKDSYIATTDGRGNYGIVCHNCKALNYNYY